MSRPYRAYLEALVNLTKEYGTEAGTLLTGICDPQDRVSARLLTRLCDRAIGLTRDPLLGLRYGVRLNVNTHGIVGYALMSSRTAGRALDLLLSTPSS